MMMAYLVSVSDMQAFVINNEMTCASVHKLSGCIVLKLAELRLAVQE